MNFFFQLLKFLPSLTQQCQQLCKSKLVNLFLNNKIKFIDISNILLKICSLPEFDKFKLIKPKNIDEINNLADYVSLKIDSLGV